jgi:hypothetical protein
LRVVRQAEAGIAGTDIRRTRAHSGGGSGALRAPLVCQHRRGGDLRGGPGAKGSFYYFFPSKQAPALEVIDRHWEWQRGEWQRILSASEPIVDRLRDPFVATAEMQNEALRGKGAVVGCLFGNLALKVSEQDGPVRARLQQIFEEQIDIVEAALGEA